jgi:hypothetical protein
MIEDVETGRRIATAVKAIDPRDLRSLGRGWRLDWKDIARTAEVFKLIRPRAPRRPLGLIALERHGDFVEITHLEAHPDHVGRGKKLRGIAGNLIAYAAQVSLEMGAEGFVALVAKTELIDHYRKTYGFQRVGNSHRMILGELAASRLIRTYLEESPS